MAETKDSDTKEDVPQVRLTEFQIKAGTYGTAEWSEAVNADARSHNAVFERAYRHPELRVKTGG